MSENLNEKLFELTIQIGTKTAQKVLNDMTDSKHTRTVMQESVRRKILPNGDSCVACVMSNWKYSFASVDKVEIGAYFVLQRCYNNLIENGIFINDLTLEECMSEVGTRISAMRYR